MEMEARLMNRTQRLTFEDLGEGWVATLLLDAEPDTYMVAGLRRDSAGEHVDYQEEASEAAARATAEQWRSSGSEVAVWRKVV
jgi:hypothetical protein